MEDLVVKNIEIRRLKIEDYDQVAEIYLEGIRSGHATFETQAPTWQHWMAFLILECSFVIIDSNKIAGWAALGKVSNRQAYKGVAEVSIYISNENKGKGFGQQLLEKLVLESENQGIWTLFASIFPENLASINLHKKMGFREIGYREKIAQMNGVWRNTIIMERRSEKVGI